MPFVVTSPVFDGCTGKRIATARVFVATRERAEELAAQGPDRKWHGIHEDDMPGQALEAMRKARDLDAA